MYKSSLCCLHNLQWTFPRCFLHRKSCKLNQKKKKHLSLKQVGFLPEENRLFLKCIKVCLKSTIPVQSEATTFQVIGRSLIFKEVIRWCINYSLYPQDYMYILSYCFNLNTYFSRLQILVTDYRKNQYFLLLQFLILFPLFEAQVKCSYF